MDLLLHGKRVVILSGTAGIGFATAQAFAAEGANVFITGRSEEKLSQALSQIPNSQGMTIDYTQPLAGAQTVEKGVEALGGIDILVTNCGGPPLGTFTKITPEQWETSFYLVFMSAADAIRTAIPHMREGGGAVVMNLSTSAKEPLRALTISNALRPGLVGLMKSIATEEAKNNIRLNAVLPGFTKTDHLLEVNPQAEQLTRDVPMGRLGEAEEQANLITFLASSKASFLTGQAIANDGGLVRGV